MAEPTDPHELLAIAQREVEAYRGVDLAYQAGSYYVQLALFQQNERILSELQTQTRLLREIRDYGDAFYRQAGGRY